MLSHPPYALRTSIHHKVLRQSVLLVAFCVLLLGGLAFYQITSFWAIALDPLDALHDVRVLALSVLIMSGLLLLLATLLSTLLARGLTGPLRELAGKVAALRPGTWNFRQTIESGDEVEMLDRVVDDLTRRLRGAYEHLEDIVAERTRQWKEEYALDRAILQSIEYGVLTMDDAGTVTDVNPAACRILESERSVLLGQKGSDVLPLLQRNNRTFSDTHPVTQVLQNRASYRSHPSMHVSLLRKDQTGLPITLLVTPLLLSERTFGVLAVFRDETLERQIDYLKSEFITLASHQLRTPLSSIRWYIEMLKNEVTPSDRQSYVQEIDAASSRMANLIEALLHVARLEEGALTPEKKSMNLTELLRRLIDEWTATAREAGIALHVMLPTSPVTVATDPILLEIVLQNLFTNAMKYSPSKKPIQVTLAARPDRATVTVADAGIGIPQVEQPRIFQKFFRAKNVREIDTDGTGLGLYMSKTIVDALGGTLNFTSDEGKGSAFVVELPL